MPDGSDARRLVWAKWRVNDDGTVTVVATYAEAEGYRQEEQSFDSLGRAAAELGESLRDVIERSLEAGSRRGRWRP